MCFIPPFRVFVGWSLIHLSALFQQSHVMKEFHCVQHLVFWQQKLNLNLILDFSQVGVKSVSVYCYRGYHSYFKLVILLIIHRLGFEDSFRQNSMIFSLFTHFCTSKGKLMFLIDYLRERGQVRTETPHALCWLDKKIARISCCTEIKSSTF